jgi:hypothetical protein
MATATCEKDVDCPCLDCVVDRRVAAGELCADCRECRPVPGCDACADCLNCDNPYASSCFKCGKDCSYEETLCDSCERERFAAWRASTLSKEGRCYQCHQIPSVGGNCDCCGDCWDDCCDDSSGDTDTEDEEESQERWKRWCESHEH